MQLIDQQYSNALMMRLICNRYTKQTIQFGRSVNKCGLEYKT